MECDRYLEWAYAYGSTPYRMATGIGLPENATNIVSRSDGAGPVVYPHTSHIERVRGKDIASGQYHEIKRSGESVDVSAWADFGMGLDLKCFCPELDITMPPFLRDDRHRFSEFQRKYLSLIHI